MEREEDLCPECRGVFHIGKEERVCSQCGYVEDVIHQGLSGISNKYVESPTDLRGHGAPYRDSVVDNYSTDIKVEDVRILSGKARTGAYKLKRANSRYNKDVKHGHHDTLKFAVAHIDVVASQFNFSRQATDECVAIFRKLQEDNLLVGKGTYNLVPGIVLYVSRQSGYTASIKSLIILTGISSKMIFKMYKLVKNHMKSKPVEVDMIPFIHKYCSDLKLSNDIVYHVVKLYEKLKASQYIAGRNPHNIIGALIYLVCKRLSNWRSQQAVATVVNMTEVSVRNRCHDIEKIMKEELKKCV